MFQVKQTHTDSCRSDRNTGGARWLSFARVTRHSSRSGGYVTATSAKVSTLARVIQVVLLILPSSALYSQGYDDTFEMKSKLKVELQYADYGDYEYPEPIIYQFGTSPYSQPQPYIVNFPEKRGLIKFSRLINDRTALGVRYQFADIREGAHQHFLEAKYTVNLSESTVGLMNVQYLYDTRGFNAYQAGIGGFWQISPLTSVQGDVQYYVRGPEAVSVGGRLGTLNFRAKFRQVLTLTMAFQAEYQYYDTKGDGVRFNSHNVTAWLSQYLPTETAVHASLRYYTNNAGIQSVAPALEIAQYIDWATVLWLKARYYRNKSSNVSLGEQGIIVPDGLESRTYSIQLNRELNASILLYGKYRYYTSNLNVQMNTYMLGCVYSF